MALQRGRDRERCRANAVATQGRILDYEQRDRLTKDGMLGRTCRVVSCLCRFESRDAWLEARARAGELNLDAVTASVSAIFSIRGSW